MDTFDPSTGASETSKPAKAHKSRYKPVPDWLKKHRARIRSGYVPLRLRSLFPAPRSKTLLGRSLEALWPWEQRGYPGTGRLRAWLVGMASTEGAREYAKPGKLPRMRGAMLAERLEAKAAELLALAAEARAYAVASDQKLTRKIITPPTDYP